MKITRQSLIAASTLAIGAFIGASALVALAQWTPPSNTPPTPNVPAPINVGSAWQNRLGPITVGTNACDKDASGNCVTMDVSGTGFFSGDLGLIGNLVYRPGGSTVADNQVLVSSGGNGTMKWSTNAGSGGKVTSLSAPVTLGVQYGAPGWQTISNSTLLAAGVPSTATAVIIDIPYGGNEYVNLRKSASAPNIFSITTGYWTGTNINYLSAYGGQVVQPLSSSGTFDWQAQYVSNAGVPWAGISLVGYVN